MKVDLNQIQKNVDWHYPCLGIAKDKKEIILFDKEMSGTILYAAEVSSYMLGQHDQHWNMSQFDLYHGSIRLEND